MSDFKKTAGLRILVVEDSADCAESTAMLLRKWGHAVEIARDGTAALTMEEIDQPDVVLLDIGLPGSMDGWEVGKRIKDKAGANRPFTIAITGYAREADRIHSTESGIDMHLIKPVNPAALQLILSQFQVAIGN